MNLFKKEPNFKLMGKRYYAFVLSGLIIAAGIIALLVKGFNLGIDFSGGTLIEVSFRETRSIEVLRKAMGDAGFDKAMIQRADDSGKKFFIKTLDNTGNTAQETPAQATPAPSTDEVSELEKISWRIDQALLTDGEKVLRENKLDINNSSEKSITDFLSSRGVTVEDAQITAEKIIEITRQKETGLIGNIEELEALELKQRVMSILREETFFGSFTFLSTEVVGPQVGHDLREKATLATVWAMLGMLIYIGFRFRFIFGIAAVFTLIHDVLVTLSFLLFFQIEFSLQIVAAIMTIVGYSLNDTIVIFDRVRDNIKLMRRDDAERILDRSINQTLSRTIVTSGTTLSTVLALFFLGGEVIHGFSFTLIIGIIVGTYSSIFQSCAWLRIWENYFLGRKKS